MTARSIALFLYAVFSIFLFLSPSFAAGPQQDMEIVMDASGSMWAQIKGEPKTTIAKRVLAELVEGLKGRDDLALGIRVYGHQSPQKLKNCQDTKLEIPFGPPDPQKVKALIKGINAQGQTPIAYSLYQAKNDFDLASKRKRTIVLITDGMESCDGDPCQAAKDLAAAGVDVTLHVVGFDLKPEEMEKLKCLAKPTGGLTLGAQDAGQLKDALGTIVKKEVPNTRLSGIAKDSAGKPLAAKIEILRVAGIDEKFVTANDSGEKPAVFYVEPGIYKMVFMNLKSGERRTIANFELKDGDEVSKEMSFGQAKLSAIAKDVSGRPIKGRIEILEMKGLDEKFVTADFSGENPKAFYLAPGTYKMKIRNENTGEVKVIDGIVLQDGAELAKEALFGQARITGIARDATGRPVKAHVTIMKIDGADEKFWDAGDSGETPRIFNVAPGVYKMIFVSQSGVTKSVENVRVDEGGEAAKEVTF